MFDDNAWKKGKETRELLTGIGTSKLPGNGSVVRIAVSLQGRNALAQIGAGFHVWMDALASLARSFHR